MAVDYSNFNSFIATTYDQKIGEGECWDYINLIWSHLESKYWTYPPNSPEFTNHGVKWGWILLACRQLNTIAGAIEVVYHLEDIKRGDIMVFSFGDYGHAGFVNHLNNNNTVSLYSQNYSAEKVTLEDISTDTFLGAFRYMAWQTVTPTPPTSYKKPKFPFVLYARKLRGGR